MVEYDSKIIQKFAERLYSQAITIQITYPLLFGFLLMGLFYIFELYLHRSLINNLVVFVAGALIGYLFAREKAFQLKLKAQTALCDVKIEENTRKID